MKEVCTKYVDVGASFGSWGGGAVETPPLYIFKPFPRCVYSSPPHCACVLVLAPHCACVQILNCTLCVCAGPRLHIVRACQSSTHIVRVCTSSTAHCACVHILDCTMCVCANCHDTSLSLSKTRHAVTRSL